MCRLKVGPLA